MDFKTKTAPDLILTFLEEKRIIRAEDLITHLTEGKQFGRATIARHLKKLKEAKQIVAVPYPTYQQYGIQAEDRKAVYYVLSSQSQTAKYYDTIIQALKSKDPTERKRALVEIESIGEIKLLPVQLTELSDILPKEDEKNCYDIVRVLTQHINRHIYPSNPERFQTNLIACFKQKRHIQERENNNLRAHILELLGVFDNSIIIEFLKEDINDAALADDLLRNDYRQWSVQLIVAKHPAELFELGKSLSEERYRLLGSIRAMAKGNKLFHEETMKYHHQKMQEAGLRK